MGMVLFMLVSIRFK